MDETRRNNRFILLTTFTLFFAFLWLAFLAIKAIKEVAGILDVLVVFAVVFMTFLMGYISLYSIRNINGSANRFVLWYSINDIVDVVFLGFIIGIIVQKNIPSFVLMSVIALGTFAWKYFFYTNVFPLNEKK